MQYSIPVYENEPAEYSFTQSILNSTVSGECGFSFYKRG